MLESAFPCGDRSPRKTDQILAGAQEVFLARGFEAASMDEVARVAGVARSTLYTHFASKEDLFAAMMHAECGQLTERLRAPEVGEGPIGDVLRRVGRRIMEVLLKPETLGIYRTVLAEVRRFPELGVIFYESGPRAVSEQVALLLEAAHAEGEVSLTCPREAAEHFLGLLQRHILLRYLLCLVPDDPQADREAAVDRSVAVFLRAYEPRGG